MKSISRLLFPMLLIASAVSSASAVNLLANGDFESCTTGLAIYPNVPSSQLFGWTKSGNVDLFHTNAVPRLDSYSVNLIGSPGAGSISQSLVLSGGMYDLGFMRNQDQKVFNFQLNPVDQMYWSITDGVNSYGGTLGVSGSWQSFQTSVYLSGNTTLTLGAHLQPGHSLLAGPVVDNISLEAQAVPEPTSIAALAIGVAGLLRRRFRRD